MDFSLGELAVKFGCDLVGDPKTRISFSSTLISAKQGDLSFYSNVCHVYIYVDLQICLSIYIYREREKKKERKRKVAHMHTYIYIYIMSRR